MDPHLQPGPSIEWADGENAGPLSKKYLVKAPAPLTPFTHDGQTYTVLEYTKEGVTFTISAVEPTHKRKRTTRSNTQKKATESPASKQKKAKQKKTTESAASKQKKATKSPASKQNKAKQKKATESPASKQNKAKQKKATESAAPKSWLKCNAPALSSKEHERLAISYAELQDPKDEAYYAFVHRVCKEYKSFIAQKNRLVDELHSKRDTLLSSAISQVFCQMRASDKPHAGNTNDAKKAIINIVEAVFQMPEAGSAFGSLDWIKEQCSNPRAIAFKHAAKFPSLMTRLVKHLIKHGGDHGFPLLQVGEEIPHNGTYTAHKSPGRAKGSKKAHKLMPFLNVSSVNKATADLKDLGYYPVRCKMPGGGEWHNFAQVLYTFWILYCNYEGIVRTQDLARIVLTYCFFAKLPGPTGTKKWPLVRYIHRLVTNGRHRFAATTSLHFDDLFRLLDKHPHLLKHLTDKGKGKVPVEYNAAIENGMRSHGLDLHAMGTNAMRSKEDWSGTRKWMKREAYIAAARHKLGRGSYHQWDHFEWSDYCEREALSLTFEKRHLPLSTGSMSWPDELVVNPVRWSETKSAKTIQKKVARASRRLSGPSIKPACASTSPDVMIFDPVLGKLIPVDSSDETEDEGLAADE